MARKKQTETSKPETKLIKDDVLRCEHGTPMHQECRKSYECYHRSV